MWLKICGMRTAAAVEAALDAGVDAIGCIFAPSVRRVTPQAARLLAQAARGRAQCVAVMRHPTQAEVDEVVDVFRPDLLQIDAADLAALRLPATLGLLPVLRSAAAVTEPLPPRLLFEGPASGSGTLSDWRAAAALARRAQLVLAGGLRADNVASALAAVRPYGVDVSSGVELEPGVKDPQLIGRFVAAVRRAAAAATSEV